MSPRRLMTSKINTDPGIREVIPGDRDKAIANVITEVFHLFPLLLRELMEIFVQIDAGDLIRENGDRMGVFIRDRAVIFISIPPLMLGVPYTAVSLEFTNTDGLRETVSCEGKGGSSRESHRKKSDSPYTGVCTCGRRQQYRDDCRGCAWFF